MPTIPDGAVCYYDNVLFKRWNYSIPGVGPKYLIQWKRLSAETKKSLDMTIYNLYRKNNANLISTILEFLNTYEEVYGSKNIPRPDQATLKIINGLIATKPSDGNLPWSGDITGPRYPYGTGLRKAFKKETKGEKKLSPKPPIAV